MADRDGTILAPASMGMPAGTPETTIVVVELREIDGQTAMTMTHRGVPAGSPGARGWEMAFDKLADLLAD